MGLLSENYTDGIVFFRQFHLHISSGCLYRPAQRMPLWYFNFVNSIVPVLTIRQAAEYFRNVVVDENVGAISQEFGTSIHNIQTRLSCVASWQNGRKCEYQIIGASDRTEVVLYSFTIEHVKK